MSYNIFVKNKFAVRLNELLTENKISKRELAKKIGVSATSISDWSTVSFLAEEYEDGFTTGYTPNYIKVYIPARLAAGKIYNIKLKELFKDGANAEII